MQIRHVGLTNLLQVMLLILGLCSVQIAQAMDTEPNNQCTEAEIVGEIELPFLLEGELTSGDVDFYRFRSSPGTEILVDMRGAPSGPAVGYSLEDPFLGLFGSNCNLLSINDDFSSLESQLYFIVPDDGEFILAANSCCDFEFVNGGGGTGTYGLAMAPPPPTISSINVRVLDALSGQPLRGDAPPWAWVSLRRCENGNCFEVMALNPNSEGRVRFETDFGGRPLSIGEYQIFANADDYIQNSSQQFTVGESEELDIGDIALSLPSIFFSDIEPCESLPPQGDTCSYFVRINNNTSKPLSGQIWSMVDGFNLGSELDYTAFEAGTLEQPNNSGRQQVYLESDSGKDVNFRFFVPSFVSNGAVFCTRVFFGLHPSPIANTAKENSLFCIEKTALEIRVMTESASKKALARAKERSLQ